MSVLLAVSGGIDSMYLANRAPELFSGEEFSIAHCNFRLRGEESEGDEAFVRSWCEDRKIRLHVAHFDTAGVAQERGISIEMAARELRYDWFASLCEQFGYRGVAVAHNANDNAETLILNLLRGTGSRGVRGMAAESCRDSGLVILRPMLDIDRKSIESWMRGNGCKWREDSSNGENAYKRNIIRNEVFPIFERINPGFLQTLNSDMKRLAQADDIADSYFRAALSKVTDIRGIVIDRLLELEHWEPVLWRLLEELSLSEQTFGKLTALLRKYKNYPRGTVTVGGKVFQSPLGQAVIKGGRISIHKGCGQASSEP